MVGANFLKTKTTEKNAKVSKINNTSLFMSKALLKLLLMVSVPLKWTFDPAHTPLPIYHVLRSLNHSLVLASTRCKLWLKWKRAPPCLRCNTSLHLMNTGSAHYWIQNSIMRVGGLNSWFIVMSCPVDFLGGGGCEECCMCARSGSGKPVPTTYCACFVKQLVNNVRVVSRRQTYLTFGSHFFRKPFEASQTYGMWSFKKTSHTKLDNEQSDT